MKFSFFFVPLQVLIKLQGINWEAEAFGLALNFEI